MKRFFIHTFGCRVNEAESEKISLDLVKAGWKFDQARPDYYLVNTCAVTAKAEREVRQHIYQTSKKFPQARIVLTGCAATYWEEKGKLLEEVDLLVNNQDKDRLADIMINDICKDVINHVSTLSYTNKYLASGRAIFKIQEGCNRFCSYCLTAYLRGKPKSVLIKNLIKEINSYPFLLQEVILAAINTAAYGADTGENLVSLIKTVLNKTKIKRLSFGSIHPWSFNQDFFKYYQKLANNQRFVQFFHIPFQSGSDSILKLMRRGYKQKEIKLLLNKIKEKNPAAFIGTDIIVGFPGETETEFKTTYRFLEEAPIDRFHVFRFSKRPDTAAYELTRTVREPNEALKAKRARVLRELGQKKYRKFLQSNIGRKTTALIIRKDSSGVYSGLLNNQLPVLVKSGRNLIGKIYPVRVTQLENTNLIAELA